jgi:hypothetical protein
LHNAIVRHVGDCEDFSYGDFSFRLNFSLQSWQENLPTMSDYFWLREGRVGSRMGVFARISRTWLPMMNRPIV